jgi:CheY-like chemotaxis protein
MVVVEPLVAERRRDRRVTTRGSVIVRPHDGEGELCGRAIDLSIGGLRLCLNRAVPGMTPGMEVSVGLRLDGPSTSWIELRGEIRRVIGPRTLAIAFDAPPATLAALIAEELTAATTRASSRQILLVDAHTPRRTKLATALRELGCVVAEATTPLDTLDRLSDSRHPFAVVALADAVVGTDPSELAAVLTDADPGLPVVLLAESVAPRAATRIAAMVSRAR